MTETYFNTNDYMEFNKSIIQNFIAVFMKLIYIYIIYRLASGSQTLKLFIRFTLIYTILTTIHCFTIQMLIKGPEQSKPFIQ